MYGRYYCIKSTLGIMTNIHQDLDQQDQALHTLASLGGLCTLDVTRLPTLSRQEIGDEATRAATMTINYYVTSMGKLVHCTKPTTRES